MTKIEYAIKGNEFSIECKGHAGYANAGNDIVCAAISTLTQTMLNYCIEHDLGIRYHIDNGYIWMYSNDEDALKILEYTLCGLQMIESEFPQYIQLSKGCTIIAQFDKS